MSVIRGFATVLTEFKTSEHFHIIHFLVKHRLLTQQDAGFLASLEGSSETKTHPLQLSDTVLTDGIADIVSFKSAVLVCRVVLDCESSTPAGRLQIFEVTSPLVTSEKRRSQRCW